MDLPAHTFAQDPENPCVLCVIDAEHGLVGKYAWYTATGPGAFMARRVGGWTPERIKAAVETAIAKGEM
jgi:hypothetical protein